jgi:predicted amidohydrolase
MGRKMNFHSIYSHGFARVAACTIASNVADPSANATAIMGAARACHEKSVAVAVFPELCLSGYAIEDLLLQDALLDAVVRGLTAVVEASTRFMSVLIVGAPLRQGSRIYTPDNDPHGEHDFGAIDRCRDLFFEIDYYDQSQTVGLPDPANMAATHRVLSAMRADEY